MDLTQREIDVLTMRFGLYDTPILPISHIAHALHVTKARTYQIQNKAFRKLIHPSRRYYPIIKEIINTEFKNPYLEDKYIKFLRKHYRAK